ncbi:HFL333Cp [Eremothecium sinecaudum]|uniref:HFL333Cp n=1 Tax=Eremothecium sinecaudum TaxID=45286 RepID=A0A109UZS9_9SACH|nr:HFL333Cp [Eremothecium sinecaudum]AMD21523.1 HFL333Cp [Eremothecium sinecaudum]
MSDRERNISSGPLKSRSLSSYLSNVGARKIELKNIAKREKENKAISEDIITASAAQCPEDGRYGTAVSLEDTDKMKPHDPGAENSASLITSAVDRNNDHDGYDAPTKSTVTEQTQLCEPMIHTRREQSFHRDLQRPAVWEHAPKDGENNEELEIARHESHKRQITDAVEPTARDIEHPLNKEPSGMENMSQEHRRTSMSTSAQLKKRKNESAMHEGDESPVSEYESDAPTEPASPPKPRLGRLIRGDQLGSLSNTRGKLASKNIPHDSDSELSDLADLNSVPISSSVFNGESSPVKTHANMNSSPRKSSDLVNSHKSHHKNLKGKNKHRKHVAVTKVVKPKKRVHRDAGGRTKLQIACDKGKYDVVRKLIEEGYDVNDQDNAGNSPLHEAALNGHFDIVKLLLDHGANVNLQSYEMFKDTPLIDASANGHLKVVEELLRRGADPTLINSKGLTAFESIEDDSDLDEEEKKIVMKIKSLLRRAVQKNRKHDGDSKAFSPRSRVRDAQSEEEDTSQNTISFKDEFYWTDISSKVGKEKLFHASKEGRLAYVGAFLENGGNADFRSFMESVKFGHEDIASLFLAFGASVNGYSKDGMTPLMAAVGRGHFGTVKLLIEAGADPTKCDRNGRSVLSYAKDSPMGLTDEKEIFFLKEAIKKRKGYVPDDEGEGNSDHNEKEECIEDVKLKDEPDVVGDRANDLVTASGKRDDFQDNEIRHFKRIKAETPTTDEDTLSSTTDRVCAEPRGAHSDQGEDAVLRSPRRRAASPLTKGAMEDLENSSNQRDKHVPQSPSRLKRSISVTSVGSDAASKKNKQDGTPTPTVTPHHETAEERDARIKSEELYKIRRMENRRKKEQEFLQKLADDERKREEERERAIQERKKREQEEEQKLQQRERELRDQEEVEKRKTIRQMYPLGLKLVDFMVKDDYHHYFPILYIVHENQRYVLDTQISIILKDPNFAKQPHTSLPVASQNLPQLWNVYKFIFLHGGYGAKTKVDFQHLSFEKQLLLEAQEYKKFTLLQLHWVLWDEIQWPGPVIKTAAENNLRELELLDLDAIPSPKNQNFPSQEGQHSNTRTVTTPARFRCRPAVTAWLSGVTLW